MDPALKDSDGDGIDDGMEDPDNDGLNRTGLIAKYCPSYEDHNRVTVISTLILQMESCSMTI